GTRFSDGERGDWRDGIGDGAPRNNWRPRRESSDSVVRQLLFVCTRQSTLARAAPGVCKASGMDDSGICSGPGGSDDPADHGRILCRGGDEWAHAGAAEIFWNGILDWVCCANDRGRNLGKVDEGGLSRPE